VSETRSLNYSRNYLYALRHLNLIVKQVDLKIFLYTAILLTGIFFHSTNEASQQQGFHDKAFNFFIEGKINVFHKEHSGGIGCLTTDSFPDIDSFCENVYIIADSNHGYKMMGVGKLVAEELLKNKETKLLKPFRFNRYAKGELHPTSNSPFPWS